MGFGIRRAGKWLGKGLVGVTALASASYMGWQEKNLVTVPDVPSYQVTYSTLDVEPANLNQFANNMRESIPVQLPDTTKSEAERIIEESLPYYAHELGNSKANEPSVVMIDGTLRKPSILGGASVNGMYMPLSHHGYNKVLIEPKKSPYFVYVTVHEAAHAQVMVESPYRFTEGIAARMGRGKQTTNELFTIALSLETLANQALAGNRVAEYTFWDRVGTITQDLMINGPDNTPYDPAAQYHVLAGAITGRKPSFENIQLDGIAKLVNDRYNASYGPIQTALPEK